MTTRTKGEVFRIGEHDVTITNPEKIYFPQAGVRKVDLVLYYMKVAEAAIRGCYGRPMLLKRYVDGIDEEPFFQKRAPDKRPAFIEIATFRFPSGRHADEVVVRNAAQLAWIVNLGCIDLNPHPVRAEDMEHPDELRIDLDPVPGVEWKQIVDVALVAREVLSDLGLVGWPKTSGSRGVHVWVRIQPKWAFADVRRAALAIAREVERRAPSIATSKWWKEERHGVFLDYNQNARDRTTSSAYSVRPTVDARVSMPLSWDDLATSDPAEYTIATVPEILAARGDAHAKIDQHAGDLEPLLELAAAYEKAMGDAPWPPHFEKQSGEKPRVQPSRARKAAPRAKMPLIVIAKAQKKKDALEGLARWKEKHPAVVALLAPEDILVDSMRGRSSAWTRVRVNLRAVPEDKRPAEVAPDPDFDPWAGFR